MIDWSLPRLRRDALVVSRRNWQVWRKLIWAGMLLNFGEPFLYLIGMGFGLGFFIGDMNDMPYLTFLASGIVASSAMMAASFEGLYSVFTRMVPQQSYEAMLATPLEVDDIVAGEMIWCATKSLIACSAILAVASLLGAVASPVALLALPVIFLTGLCFAGPAILMASLSPSYDFFAFYTTLLLTPMMLFCGVFYPSSALPELVQPVVAVLPLTHAVALMRPLVAGLPVTDVLLHVGVLSAYALVGYYGAVVLVRRRLIT